MAKKVSRSRTAAPKGGGFAAKAKAAGKKQRVGFTEYDEGTYVFQLMDLVYGTSKDPKAEVFFTKLKFVTGEYKGQSVSIRWNVDAKKTFGEGLTNFDFFYWFLEELTCIPDPWNSAEDAIKKVKRMTPHFRANLTKRKTDQGGVFYDAKYAKKLTKGDVAAL